MVEGTRSHEVISWDKIDSEVEGPESSSVSVNPVRSGPPAAVESGEGRLVRNDGEEYVEQVSSVYEDPTVVCSGFSLLLVVLSQC